MPLINALLPQGFWHALSSGPSKALSCRWAALHLFALMMSVHIAFLRRCSLCLQTGTIVHGHVALIEYLLPHLKSQVHFHATAAGVLSGCMAH